MSSDPYVFLCDLAVIWPQIHSAQITANCPKDIRKAFKWVNEHLLTSQYIHCSPATVIPDDCVVLGFTKSYIHDT